MRGRHTDLRLRHEEPGPSGGQQLTIHGETDDLYKISCLDCIVNSSGGGHRDGGRGFHYTNAFPHYVTIGHAHLDPLQPSIKSVRFRIDDMESVFYDFDAFGHVKDPKGVIDTVVGANKLDRAIPVGDSPIVSYFNGKLEVVAVQTSIGQITVNHWPSFSMSGPNGASIKNRMMVTLTPAEPIIFDECIERLLSINRFLSLLAGRKQGIQSILLYLASELDDFPKPLHLRWAYAPKGSKSRRKSSSDRPHPGDIPLDAVRRPEEFAAVLSDWTIREASWRLARARYDGCLRKGNIYDVDRLVAAANMFDILPEEAVDVVSQLSHQLLFVQADCLKRLRPLPVGIERDSVISALKRMGKASLPKKVLYRTKMVEKQLGHHLPDLQLVAKTAVKCRNYFVHGGSDGFYYPALERLTPFLTDALEFIFAASDLIEAGWDATSWGNAPHGWGHSFTKFLAGYQLGLAALKEALGMPTGSA